MELLITAVQFASQKHKNQRRKNKDNEPYVNHVIGTCKIASDSGVVDTNILCACLLHDTIEDTCTSIEELESLFGVIIKDMVLEVSDDKKLSKSERKNSQIEKSLKMTYGAKCVKLADKIYNLKDMDLNPPESWSNEYIIGSCIWMKTIVDNMFVNLNDSDNIDALTNLKIVFDDAATKLLNKFNINYGNIENEKELLDNYIYELCK